MLYAMIASFFLIHASMGSKSDCSVSELKNKKCSMSTTSNKLEIQQDQIFISTKDRKISLIENPFSSDYAEWTQIQFVEIGGKIFLSLQAWDMPGESGQNLTEIIYQLEKNTLKALTTQILQTRVWDSEKKSFDRTTKSVVKIEVTPKGKIQLYKDQHKLE